MARRPPRCSGSAEQMAQAKVLLHAHSASAWEIESYWQSSHSAHDQAICMDWKRMRGVLDRKGPILDYRKAVPLALWEHDASSRSIDLSIDGCRWLAGYSNGTVTFRDTYDTTLLGVPL